MQSSLLLLDQLHSIVPALNYVFDYGDQKDIAEASELIGARLVPNDPQKRRAHAAIERTIEAVVPSDLYYVAEIDRPARRSPGLTASHRGERVHIGHRMVGHDLALILDG